MSELIRNKLIVSLDVDIKEEALDLARELKSVAGAFKLGPRLVYRYGQDLVKEIAKLAPIFIDCKFFDIPSTMLSAIEASFESGASLVTIHSLSGKDALTEISKLEKNLNQERPFKVLNVTILTSWDENNIPSNFKSTKITENVSMLSDQAISCGLDGFVCSPEEIKLINSKFTTTRSFIVTPGIRLKTDALHDQKRVMGPADAISLGASALVVGRPIITAKKPKEVAEKYLTEIKSACP